MRDTMLFAVVLGVLMVVSVSARLNCPIGWSLSNGKCYKFVQCTNKNECYINRAGRLCDTKYGKATLASVHSLAENSFVSSLAPYHITELFIGGRDGLSEGVWRWPDASLAGYTYWNKDQPDNCCGGQNCMLIWKRQSNHWDDASCNHKYNPGSTGFVCEKGANC